MSLEEFMVVLRGLEYFWLVNSKVCPGRYSSDAIRGCSMTDSMSCCPITALCLVTTGKYFPEYRVVEAVQAIRLSDDDASRLLKAIDGIGQYSLRRRILAISNAHRKKVA